MIAPSDSNGQHEHRSIYQGYSPTVDRISDRNAKLESEEVFDATPEISLKQSQVVEYLELEKAARANGSKAEAIMALAAMRDKAVDGVLKAKQVGASIHASGTVWNDYKAKRFVMRIISLLETMLADQPEVLQMLLAQLEGVRRTFTSAESSTYTPDQDLGAMDATIPAR